MSAGSTQYFNWVTKTKVLYIKICYEGILGLKTATRYKNLSYFMEMS